MAHLRSGRLPDSGQEPLQWSFHLIAFERSARAIFPAIGAMEAWPSSSCHCDQEFSRALATSGRFRAAI